MAKPDTIFASELDGREVMDLHAGEVIGAVTDFCLTRDGTVTLIGVLPLQWYRGGQGVAPGAVTNITSVRVSIEDAGLLEQFGPDSETQLSYMFDGILGKEVLQSDGEYLGGLADFAFDLNNGRITDIVVMGDGDKRQKIAVDRVQTIGRSYMIVARAGAEVSPGPKLAASTAVKADVGAAETQPSTAAYEPPVQDLPPSVFIPAGREPEADTPPDQWEGASELHSMAPPEPVLQEPPITEYDDKFVLEEEAGPLAHHAPAAGELDFELTAKVVEQEIAHTVGLDQLGLSAFDRRKADFLLGKAAHTDIRDANGALIASRGDTLDAGTIAALMDSGQLTRIFLEMTSHRA